MQKNILEYLENTARNAPDKIAFSGENENLTFFEIFETSRAIGTFLINKGIKNSPIVVFMGKRPSTIAAFLGVVYSGSYYVPIDEDIPEQRAKLIFDSLGSFTVIVDKETKNTVENYGIKAQVFLFEEIIKTTADDKCLDNIRQSQIDTDPVYIVFTSGSTGVPKGVVACHRSVIDYIDNLTAALGLDLDTVFGNQAPFYVDGKLKDIYSVLKLGATAYLIPKKLFMFPLLLAEFLNHNKINTILWAASALKILSSFEILDKNPPVHLRTIAFGSEVFPVKHLKLFKKHIPAARYFNLYGPTEATGMSCYYEVKRDFNEDELIPIGKPFNNTEIILLDHNNQEVKNGQKGEICIKGISLALGYYRDFDRSNRVFVQNPLNSFYPETIYRTGDIGRYNKDGDLVFISRKDNQIKHMGYRIELGEIEVATNCIKKIQSSCCIFDHKAKRIMLFYVGEVTKQELIKSLKVKLPRYMLPNEVIKLERMPLTSSGKTDRVRLSNEHIK